MGTIHLAVSQGIGGFRKLSVLKELKRELCENEQFLSLFMREARLAARLSHPNVVHTVEADQDAGRYFLAMEFLDGRPFNEILRRAEEAPPVPLALRLQVICHALTGLHHAHELADYDGRALQVVHGDVSPGNIFVTYDGQVKVLDFGVATAANDADRKSPLVFKGKIGYAAPEQLRLRPADRRTDVFACGVVLWEAIALRSLVRRRPSRQVFEARLLGTEPRIAQLVDDIDPQLAQICDRAMSTEPDHRYASAEVFCRELQGFLLERGLSVDPAQIGSLMRAKFSEERASLHRLIEEQLGSEGEPISLVLGRDQSGLVLEAGSTLGEHTGTRALNTFRPAAPSQRKLRPRLLAGLALVGLAGAAYARLRDDSSQVPSGAPVSGLQAAAPIVAANAGPSLGSATAQANRASSAAAQPARLQVKANKLGSAMPAPPYAAAEAAKPVLRRHGEGADSDAAVAQAGDASVHRQRDQPQTDPTATGGLEEVDLRRVPRGERRSLDLENPFR
jgi:hypothetical protein